jgi:two-component system response regulator NreC
VPYPYNQYGTENGATVATASASRQAPENAVPARRRIRVLVIDEAGITRDGLCALLASDDGLEVIGAVTGHGEGLPGAHGDTSSQPHVIIIDFSNDLQSGSETIARLKRLWPQVRVLALSARHDDRCIEAALRAGADGYVLKSDRRAELFDAVHRIASGKSYISTSALDRMVSTYAGTSDRLRGLAHWSGVLTGREQEVITLIAKGYRTREMAELMSLSHKTVEKHRTNLMRKLGLRSAAAVAAYAITNGLV